MELRTQLGVVGLVGLAWAGGHWVSVRRVVDGTPEAERLSLAALEARFAREPNNVVTTRVLLRRYLDHGMPRLVVDTAHRCSAGLQHDGSVALTTARAEERLGNTAAANALVLGALQRCGALPPGLGDGAGCDVRTQTELAFENAALERMIQWNITPVSDPARASRAHEMAARPVRISATVGP